MRGRRRGGGRARCARASREPVFSADGRPEPADPRGASGRGDQHREPGRLADLLASSLPFTIEEKQSLLGEINVRARLERLGQYLSRQLAILELSTKIQEQVGSELTKAQRDHFLRQQLKAIQDELGESENENPEIGELWERIKKANPPQEVQSEAERELERLAGMHPSSAEYSIVRTYLDWLAILPWSKASRDRLDLRRARKVLDADHFDLEKIKERILEYLAVRKLKKDMKGPILCLAGPPGHRQDVAGQEHRQGAGPRVRAREPGRRARRGRDSRPSPHLCRRLARARDPGNSQGGHQ